MADAVIAILLAVLTLTMAYLGVHVTLHPQTDPVAIRGYKIKFGVVAICAVILIGAQAYRALTASNELKAAIELQGQAITAQIKKEAERPIIVSPQITFPAAPSVSHPPSLRQRTLVLAYKIQMFQGGRDDEHKKLKFDHSETGWDFSEKAQRARNANMAMQDKFVRESKDKFENEFSTKISSIFGEFKAKGLDISRLKQALDPPLDLAHGGIPVSSFDAERVTDALRGLALQIDESGRLVP